jgi:AcrR family transcriptional regulator
MPRLWNETIEAHRRGVRGAIMETTAALVAEHGLRAVTMSQIAEETGIGRATLYKYFPDVEAILLAWFERQVSDHLESLFEVARQASDASGRLEAVLSAYALIAFEHQTTDLAALVHRTEHAAQAQQQLHRMVQDLLSQAADAGSVRDDVPPDELASFCLHAVAAASKLKSKAAVHRLVALILGGLRAQRGNGFTA